MTTTEKLFVQIFESKKRIIDQVKHQIDQFDHHLASICVLDGIAPPPWLLSPSFSSVAPDFNGMRKEELISELLLQRSQTGTSVLNCHYSLYQKPAVTAHNKGILNASCTEIYASNCTNGGNGLSALHPSPTDDTQCAANGVPDLDGSVASPPDCADARQSDYCRNPSPSLVNIQRSKSRQRALELRNSTKANKQKSCEGNHVGAHASQGTGSKVNPSQYDPVDDLPLANHVDANNESFRQVLKSIDSAGKKMSCDIDSDRNVRPVSCSQKKTRSVDETGNDGNLSYIADSDGFNMSLDCPLPPPNCVIGLSDLSVLAKSSSMAEANLVESRGSKKNSMQFCNKAAESSTSISQVSTQKEPFEAGNTSCDAKVDDEDKSSLEQPMKDASSNSEASRFFKSSPVISNGSYKARKASVRDQEIKKKDINNYVGRTTRSRSSRCQIDVMNESLELEKSQISSKENGLIKIKQTPDPTFELLESGKGLDTSSVSCGVEGRARDSQKSDAETSAHGCSATHSSSYSSSKKCNDYSKSRQKGVYNDVAKDGDGEHLQSLGKSSKATKQTSVVGEGVKLPNPAGIQPNFLPTSVTVTDENVADMYFNGMAENCQIASKSTSTSARCGVESSGSMPPRDCAIVVKPQQIDFDNIEDSSLQKSFSLELENNQEGITEKQHSPLLQSINEVSLHDSQKGPPIPIKIPLQKEDVSSKQEIDRKVSSEAILKENADLVKKRTFSSAQHERGSFNSQRNGANFLFMGSWPQHKRMKIGSQLTDCLSPSLVLKPCPSSNKDHMGDVLQSDAITSPVEGMGRDVEQQNLEQSEIYLSKLHDDELAISLELKGGGDALAPVLDQATTSVASLKRPAAGFSQDSLMDKPEAAYPNCTDSHVTRQNSAEDNQPLSQVSYNEDAMQESKYHFGGKKSLSHFSSSSPSNLSDVGTDQRMPEYEGFFMDLDTERPCTTNEEIDFEKLDPSTALRMASVLDQLCKSTSLCTPLSHTTGYELHEAQNTCSSLPNGVLEGMELKNVHMDCNESKLLLSSYSCLNEGVIDDLCERSQSVSSLHNALSAWDILKPCMSPVKVWDVMPPKSSSSSKRVSSIPELPCISEENENADFMADTLLEYSCPEMKMSLVKRGALADIRNNSNPPTSVCEAKIQDDRFSVASVNTELGYSGTCYRSKKKLTDHNRKRSTRNKENQNISLGGDGAKRSKGLPRSRFSKPKLSDKLGTRNGGPRLSEKESKRNNIVSNITSFVPLVQQKQAAAVVTGKRDIKVKALEAAEAAKRLAEKKENERKMKKEALKIERAKMEEANLRQLEVEKRKKEEERKKKDADMAAKKRQREEEERKERERKKMRVEEAKRNHLDNEKKLQKESKFKAANERAHDKKESKKMEKSSVENNHQTVLVNKPATIEVANNAIIYGNNSVEDHEALSGDSSKVTGMPSENHRLVSNVNREQSYEISPYKDSDNEDEEEENRRNKFRPSWASKSQLALAVSAQQKIDAKLLFPPERCHSPWKENFSEYRKYGVKTRPIPSFGGQPKNSRLLNDKEEESINLPEQVI